MSMINKLILSGICMLLLTTAPTLVMAQVVDHFQVVTENANAETAGKGFSVTLVAKDVINGTVTSYTGDNNITWTLDAVIKNSPDGWTPMLPGGIQSFVNGVAIATGTTLPNAGTYTLSATDGTITGTSTIITVKPATATQFKIAVPSTVMAGSAFSILYLNACDLYGNVAIDYHGNMTLNYSGPGTTTTKNPLYPNPVPFDYGIANLSSKITLYKAEDTRINIKDGAVTGNSGAITVSPGNLHHFEVTTQHNQTEQVGIPFSVTIRARDGYGNLASGYEGAFPIACTWTATSSPSGIESYKPLDGTQNFTNGIASIPGFTMTNASEMPTISVTDGLFSGISGNITVTPGTATKFKVTTEHNNIETANTTCKVILDCQDAYENTLTNFTGSYSIGWHWTATGMPGHPSSKPIDGTCGFVKGISTIDGWTLTNAGETPSIIANSTISGTSSPITVKPGEAKSLQIIATATVGAGQSFPLSPIVAYDYCGNIAAEYKGLKTLNYSGPVCGPISGTPSFTTQVNFSNGYSTTKLNTTLVKAGTCSIQVDDGKIQGKSGTITVTPGNATIFSLITQHNGTETAGIPFEMSIVSSDIFGNFASGYDGNQYLTWGWTATNSPNNTQPIRPQNGNQYFTNGSTTVSGLILYNAQETPVISVSDGNIRGASSQIVVMPTSVTHFEMTTQHNQAETAGATFSVSLTARDGYGNIATNYIGNKDISWGLNATSSPTGIMPAKPDNGLQIFNQGRVEVNGFRLTCAEQMATITVTEGTVTTGTCGQIIVRSGTPINFSITVPASATVNQMFEINGLIAQDVCGNAAKDYQGMKALTYTGPGDSPSGNPPNYTNPVNFMQGVAATKLLTTLVKAETVAIRVQEGALSGESTKIEVQPSLLSKFEIITKNNGTETAGQAFSVIIRVLDVYNNLDKSYTGSHSIKWLWNATRSANNSTPTLTPGDCIFFEGRAEVGGFRLVNANEMPTIIARDGSIEGSSKPISVESGRPTDFAVDTLSIVKAGEPFNMTKITAKDVYGNVAKSYTGDKSLSYSGPDNGLLKGTPSYTRVVNFDKGISTTVLKTTLYKAEKVRILVEEGDGNSKIFGYSIEIAINGANAAVFQVNTQHDNMEIAGETFSLTIRTMDEFGNEVSSYEHVHHLVWIWNAIASPNGITPDRPLEVNADFTFGVATIPGFTLTNATQTPTISVTDGSVRGTSSPIRINPNKAVSFDIAVPSPVTVNRPFNISKVAAKDTYGNIATSYTGDKILLYTGPKSDEVLGDSGYTYAAHFEKGILTTLLATTLRKEEITAITITDEKEAVVGTSNGIQVLTMGAYFLIFPHEVYANKLGQIMNCLITNNNSAPISKIQILIPYGFTFISLGMPICSDKNKVWNAEAHGQEVDLIPATMSDSLPNGETIQIQITVNIMEQEQVSVPWPCMITSGSFTLRANESIEGDSQVRITAYRLEADVFPRVILLGGTATIIAKLATIATSKPCFNGLIEFSIIKGTENACLLGDNLVYTNPSGSATINLITGTSTGTITVQVKYIQEDIIQIKYKQYDIKTIDLRIVSNVPVIIPGKSGSIKQNEVIAKPITPISLVAEEGFSVKYMILSGTQTIDDGSWTTYTSPFSVGTYGVHTIYYACVDESGNPGPITRSPLFIMPDVLGDLINYPNPFSPDIDGFTSIEYHLDSPQDVDVRIYNLFGELVRNLDIKSGDDSVQLVPWDGRNGYGDLVGNGGYICVVRVKGNEREMRRKILVVK